MKKSKLVISITLGILILACFIKLLLPNKTYEFDTSGDIPSNTDNFKHIVMDNITLSPGVYVVSLNYIPQEEDLSCVLNVEDGSVFINGLLCNGAPLWAGYDKAECYFYLYEPADSLSVFVNVSPKTPLFHYGKLTIRETNYLWSTLIVNLLFLWFLLYSLLTFIEKNKLEKISKELRIEILALGLISLLSISHFLFGYIPFGADTGYHLERIESVAYSIKDLVFPIRLESYYPFGYGYANGIFYCDISLYLPAFFRLLGFSVQSSYVIFGITYITVGIWVAYWCLKKIFGNIYFAILGTALYNMALYHVFDSVVRGGTGFLFASIFFPVLLYGYFRLFSENPNEKSYKTVWIPISIGYTGILCSHILSFEIAAFWTVIVIISMFIKAIRPKTFLELWKALGAFIILNLWFIVPFLDYYISEDLTIKNVSARQIQCMGLIFSSFIRPPFQDFYQENVLCENKNLLMNPFVVILLFVFLILWIAGVLKKYKHVKFINLAKICCIYSLISIILSLKSFPWDYLHAMNPIFEKIISALQFPFRFIGYADIFSTITICSLLWVIWQYKNNILKYSITLLTITSILIYSLLFIEDSCMKYSPIHLYDMTMQIGYLSGAEYTMYGTEYNKYRPWLTARTSDLIEVYNYEKLDLAATVDICNHSNEDSFVDVPLFYYKGYKAFDENKNELDVVMSDDFLVRAIVPSEFEGTVYIKFVSPWYWRLSEIISLIGWILFVVYSRKKKSANA